jgi:hypothetical protein
MQENFQYLCNPQDKNKWTDFINNHIKIHTFLYTQYKWESAVTVKETDPKILIDTPRGPDKYTNVVFGM